ncbi:hypothetical protein PAXRUDRAFT_797029, partial [Paxillus rubicundulus Ve08.2h10]
MARFNVESKNLLMNLMTNPRLPHCGIVAVLLSHPVTCWIIILQVPPLLSPIPIVRDLIDELLDVKDPPDGLDTIPLPSDLSTLMLKNLFYFSSGSDNHLTLTEFWKTCEQGFV